MSPSPRVADVIAAELATTGTKWAFGHPGGEVVVLIDALRRAGVNFVLMHHETSAAFAAGGYAELTGLPGICVATLGPGATNLITGTASALLERAPVIAITGALAESAPQGATHQDLPLNDLFAAVTKRSVSLTSESPEREVANAIRLARAERPGPVHLSLAADVAQRTANGRRRTKSSTAPEGDSRPVGLDQGEVDRAQALLLGARRPAIIAGLTAARFGAQRSLRHLCAKLGAPIALTPKSKGLVREDSDWFVGVLDMAGDALVGDFIESADVILAVGCDVVELDRRWTWDVPVIHIDVQPNVDQYYMSAAELVGPLPASLGRLAESADGSAWGEGEIKQRRREVLGYIRPTSNRLQPWQVVEAVQRHAGATVIATCDVGAHKMLVGQLWRTNTPRRFFMANGLSSMGYAVPTALAAHLAFPSRQVVAFLGDGGLGMYLGELETLARLKADVTLIVFADRSLELISRAEQRRGVATESVAFNNPDFAAIGAAFGIDSSEVSTAQELDAAVRRAKGGGVHLIAARIDGADYRL
jgi:acetolactate synthase-1/2/3 large subunit